MRFFEELNRVVRFGVFRVFEDIGVDCERVVEFFVCYVRVFFRDYYDYFGMDIFLDYVFELVNGEEKVFKFGRVYYFMFLVNYFCLCFWENFDMCVVFGNVLVFLKVFIEFMEYFEGSEF